MKKILVVIVIIASFASCKLDNNYMRCEERGWCSGHTAHRYDKHLTYCTGMPHGPFGRISCGMCAANAK